MNRGKLYGVGVGPGDPELLTLKALRILKQCPVTAFPHEDREKCTAYRIAREAFPGIDGKEGLALPMPMVMEREAMRASHEAAAGKVAAVLDSGRDVAFVTLGDASVYSTFLYVKELIDAAGYETEIVSGITSFCAAAARLGIPLVNGAEELHVIPASYGMTEALKLPGVKVFMKAGRRMPEVKEAVRACKGSAVMVENCGMENERIYRSVEEIPDDAGYFSLLIVR